MNRRHRALERFDVLEELSPDGGPPSLLARSKAGSVIAIHVLAEGTIADDVASALSNETSQVATLDHGAIVRMRAMILEPDFAAVVTEFIPGVSLQRLLRFATGRAVRLPDVAAWYALEQVLAALAYAHAQKDREGAPRPTLHRSIGPSNVIVGWDGTTKLDGFGLARLRALVAPVSAASKNPAGLMAPEQARGSAASERSDVFCAALLAIRLATGRTPYARFRASASEWILAMSEGNITPLSKTRLDLPRAVTEVFDLALLADPDERTVTASNLLDVVRANLDVAPGKLALERLLERWRTSIEEAVTPWEMRASIADEAPASARTRAGALAVAMPDDRPSSDALATAGDDEPWKKKTVPREEQALAPTDSSTSLSRIGSVVADALVVPLPAMRMTMPSLPTHDAGMKPAPPEKPFFSGGRGAAIVFAIFVVMIVATVFLFQALMAPPATAPPKTSPPNAR